MEKDSTVVSKTNAPFETRKWSNRRQSIITSRRINISTNTYASIELNNDKSEILVGHESVFQLLDISRYANRILSLVYIYRKLLVIINHFVEHDVANTHIYAICMGLYYYCGHSFNPLHQWYQSFQIKAALPLDNHATASDHSRNTGSVSMPSLKGHTISS